MAHITNKLRGLVAAFVAVFAALALVPGVAQADPWPTDADGTPGTATITVDGLENDDTVSFYQVATIEMNNETDVENDTKWVANTTNFPEGLVEQFVTSMEEDSSTNAEAAAQALVAGMLESAQPYAGSANLPVTNGSVTSGQLPAGLYYVQVTTPEGVQYSYQTMIIPLEPTPNGGSWTIENVTGVSAKQSSTEITKKVLVNGVPADSTSAKQGDELQFQVTFHIGKGNATFEVTDVMDGLTYKAGTVALYQGTEAAGDPIASGDSASSTYTLAPTGAQDNCNHGFVMTFDKSFLDDVTADTTYTITYTAVVCAHADADAGASNSVKTTTAQTPDEVPVTFGHAGVFKYAMEDEAKVPLDGAEFQLFYRSGEEGDYTYTPIKDTFGNNVIIDTKSDPDGYAWSDDDGINVLLKVGDKVYLKETKAPSGYKANDQYHEATVVSLDEETGYAEVLNEKSGPGDGIDLPETGGMGTVALTAAGVVLVAGAAAFIVRSRKQG